MNTLTIIAFACLAMCASASFIGYGPVGPTTLVGSSGIVSPNGVVGPSGVVTGRGAVGPTGVSNAVYDGVVAHGLGYGYGGIGPYGYSGIYGNLGYGLW